MRFPFVSRERYDELKERLAKAEEKLDRVTGFSPAIQSVRQSIPETEDLPPLTRDTDLSTVQPISGRPTLALVTAQANRAAQERAKVKGAVPMTTAIQELQLAAFKGRRDAQKEVNG